jgi:ABC-type nitrate/sulfonate/bicarbonate transport system permease component
MVLAGLRLSLGVSWMTMIAAEVLGADYFGMGELIFAYERSFKQTNVIATILSIGVVGYLMDLCFRLVQRRLTRWKLEAVGV